MVKRWGWELVSKLKDAVVCIQVANLVSMSRTPVINVFKPLLIISECVCVSVRVSMFAPKFNS